jgi:hypothetical protein
MRMSYFRASVLDLNVKLAYAEDKWDYEARKDGVSRLKVTVCIAHKSSGTMLTLFQQFNDYYVPPPVELPDDTTPATVGKKFAVYGAT